MPRRIHTAQRYTLAVRDFVEQTQVEGDLHRRVELPVTAEEGQRTHRRVQQASGSDYQAEVAVQHRFRLGTLDLLLRGRIDGLIRRAATVCIEEIKTSRAPPLPLLIEQDPLHWAQLISYGGLLALNEPALPQIELRLRYVHPDTLAEQCSEQRLSREQLIAALVAALGRWQRAESAQVRRHRQRDRLLQTLAFPFPHYRPQQRALLHSVASAAGRDTSLLLEAATGLGKSLGVLYPAIKHLRHHRYRQLWYLTAKRTGRAAAAAALRQINPVAVNASEGIRWVELSARAQCCPNPELPCDATLCRYAAGYYERVGAAILVLQQSLDATPERIDRVAREHLVCPHALARQLAITADVVIGDYQHAFEPGPYRLLPDDAALLIDEAHQLVPRVRALLSSELSLRLLDSAREDPAAGPLRSALAVCRKAFTQCLERCSNGIVDDAALSALDVALTQQQQALGNASWSPQPGSALTDWLYSCGDWLKRRALDTLHYECLVPTAELALAQSSAQSSAQSDRLQLLCVDPAPHIAEVCRRQPFSVRFSATLSPAPLYQRQHGLPDGPVVRIASPYQQDRLRVLLVPDVPTYYRRRADSLPKLVALLQAAAGVRPGAYLVGVPSFAYLEQIGDALDRAYAGSRAAPVIVRQRRHMHNEDRRHFLRALRTHQRHAVGLIVQGGVFAESLDYPGIDLAGVLVVGVGLSPPGLEQNAIARHYDQCSKSSGSGQGACSKNAGVGQTLAFLQPAMERVVQLVGRLQRAPTDRGIVVLIDDRFAAPAYGQFFPAHWQPQCTLATAVPAALADFWAAD